MKGQNTLFKLGDNDIFSLQKAIPKAFDFVLSGKGSAEEQDFLKEVTIKKSNNTESA